MKAGKKQGLQPLDAKELESVTGGVGGSIPQDSVSGGGDAGWDTATGSSGAVQTKTKTCPKCGQEIPEIRYARHVLQCKLSTGATE